MLCAQVYYFRRGAVKLSQGKFKSARNDYVISMDTGYVDKREYDNIIDIARSAFCDIFCQ